MKIIDPGHVFALHSLDGGEPVILPFVKREGLKFPGNIGHHSGTTLQETWRASISRLKHLNNQDFDDRNGDAINCLRQAIWLLEQRAAERHGRKLKARWLTIENESFCEKCGHLECYGQCHD